MISAPAQFGNPDSRAIFSDRNREILFLVAEALFVAVFASAFAAFVSVDFAFSVFLDGSHAFLSCFLQCLKNQFVQRIFDDALGSKLFQRRDEFPHDVFLGHRLHRHPLGV